MKLPLSLSILALTAALLATPLSARPGWHGGPGQDGGTFFLDRIADQIGLTFEQEQSIDALINEAELASAVDRERLSQIRDALHDLSRADGSFDRSGASVLTDEMAEIVTRSALAGAELRWNIRQVLTAGQRQQLDDHRAGSRRPPFPLQPGLPTE